MFVLYQALDCLWIPDSVYGNVTVREPMSHSHLTQSEFWIGFAHYIALLLLKFGDSWSCLDSVCVNPPVVNKLLDLDNPRTQTECGEHALVEESARSRRSRKNTTF